MGIPSFHREIDTPALVVDLDLFDANVRRMADYFRDRPSKLRPHFKTHKTPIIAHKQVAAGAIGVTCAKLGEAEVLAHAGVPGILIANQVVGEIKVRRLATLARHSDLMVAVDSVGNTREISKAAAAAGSTVGVIIEVDAGLGRSGVRPGPACIDLARLIRRLPGLQFRGIMGYEGHCVMIPEPRRRAEACRRSNDLLVKARRLIENAGIPVEIVSGGGTGTYDVTGNHPEITEVQAGSYIFMDQVYHRIRPEFGISLSVLCTVVSRPAPSRAILDGGLKTFSKGFELPEAKSCPGLRVAYLSEEHVNTQVSGRARDLKVGDKIELYTAHCCEAVNLHDRLYGVRRGRLEQVWDISARGRHT